MLWLPQSRTWQPLGVATEENREAALEAALRLPECPAADERPALSAVPLRYWQPFICSPPPPPDGHEWKAFEPRDEINLAGALGPNGMLPGNSQGAVD